MAAYHADLKTFTRSKGDTVARRLAYRIGGIIQCSRTGIVHDYRRKRGVDFVATLAPDGAGGLRRLERAEAISLWAAAETAERRCNSQLARELVLALPHELDAKARAALSVEFASHLVRSHGVAATVAGHDPTADNDARNHHLHLLWTTRTVVAPAGGDSALGKKTRQFDEKDQSGPIVAALRKDWETMTNAALAAAGVAARVDCRSLADRGITRAPRVHLGPAASAMERRGIRTRAGDYNREIDRLEAEEAFKAATENARRKAPSSSKSKPAPTRAASEDRETGRSNRETATVYRPPAASFLDDSGYEMMGDAEANSRLFSWAGLNTHDPDHEGGVLDSGRSSDEQLTPTVAPGSLAFPTSGPVPETGGAEISCSEGAAGITGSETGSSSCPGVIVQASPMNDDIEYQPMSDAEINVYAAGDNGGRLLDALGDQPDGGPEPHPDLRFVALAAEAANPGDAKSNETKTSAQTDLTRTTAPDTGLADDGYEPMSDVEVDDFILGRSGRKILDRMAADAGVSAVSPRAPRIQDIPDDGARNQTVRSRVRKVDDEEQPAMPKKTVVAGAGSPSRPPSNDGCEPMSDDEAVFLSEPDAPYLDPRRAAPAAGAANQGEVKPGATTTSAQSDFTRTTAPDTVFADDGYEPMSDAEVEAFILGRSGRKVFDRMAAEEGVSVVPPRGTKNRVPLHIPDDGARRQAVHPWVGNVDDEERPAISEKTVVAGAGSPLPPPVDDGYEPMSDDEAVFFSEPVALPPAERGAPRREGNPDGSDQSTVGAEKEIIFDPQNIATLYDKAVASSRILAFCLRAIALAHPKAPLGTEIDAATMVAGLSRDVSGQSLFREIGRAAKQGCLPELPNFPWDDKMRAVTLTKLISKLVEVGSTLLVKFILDESGIGSRAKKGISQPSGKGGLGDD